MNKLSSSDLLALTKLASSLPVGSPERKALILSLKQGSAPQLSQDVLLQYWDPNAAIKKFNEEGPKGHFDKTTLQVQGVPKILGVKYLGNGGKHRAHFEVEFPVEGKIVRGISFPINPSDLMAADWQDMDSSGRALYESEMTTDIYHWQYLSINGGRGDLAKKLTRSLNWWDIVPVYLTVEGHDGKGLLLKVSMDARWGGKKDLTNKGLQDALAGAQRELGLRPDDDLVKSALRKRDFNPTVKLPPFQFTVPMTGDMKTDLGAVRDIFETKVRQYQP